MRLLFNKLLKSYLHSLFRKKRKEMQLTQAEMAELLEMDIRSYSNIDNGKSMCSTQTFILFLLHCKPDMYELLKELSELWEKAKKNTAA